MAMNGILITMPLGAPLAGDCDDWSEEGAVEHASAALASALAQEAEVEVVEQQLGMHQARLWLRTWLLRRYQRARTPKTTVY